MTENKRLEQIMTSRDLKHRVVGAFLVVLILAIVMVAVTMAWYIYNTNSRTTDVHMAAGTSTQLQIADKYDGEYSYSIRLDQLTGSLNPVSTNEITNGFQECVGYTETQGSEHKTFASKFAPSKKSDYYKSTMFLRTNSKNIGVYVSSIEYQQSEEAKLLATAIRVGLVVHQPGENQPVANEYIFSISDEKNPNGEYNTYNGQPGYVLDSTKSDGSLVKFTPYSQKNFASYNKETSEINLTDDSLKIFDLYGTGEKKFGTPVQVDVYIWLEGCDEDCNGSIGGLSLEDLAVTFASFKN